MEKSYSQPARRQSSDRLRRLAIRRAKNKLNTIIDRVLASGGFLHGDQLVNLYGEILADELVKIDLAEIRKAERERRKSQQAAVKTRRQSA